MRKDFFCVSFFCDVERQRKDAAVGEDGDALQAFTLLFLKEVLEALLLLLEAFAMRRGALLKIVAPEAKFLARGIEVVVILHLPVAEIQFQQALVGHGIGIAAEGSEFACARERAREYGIECQSCQLLLHCRCLFGKRLSKRHIRLTIAHALRNVNARVPNEIYFHAFFLFITGKSALLVRKSHKNSPAEQHYKAKNH